MGSFDGKIAVVTGAATGIGRATALAFAREGARVVVADVAQADETVRMIRDHGGEALFVATDVSNPAQVEQLVSRTIETYGRLDVAFNNAGVGGASATTADYTLEDWNRVLNINLTGVWLCMKYEIAQMLTQGSGVIVNNASILGLVGFRNAPAYVAAKHGVLGLTKAAALEYAQSGIRVTAVCPAFIHTPMVDSAMEGNDEIQSAITAMHPVGRMGEPEEIAGGVLWLCSDAASFMTGQPLVIDGGYLAQ
jgi:NAD(P)-dependent dehydrogenase (short-subunit alcohol dehydrogenase family)